MQNLVFDLDNTLYPHNSAVEADFARRIKAYFSNQLSLDFENESFNWEKASVNIGAYLNEIFRGREGQRRDFVEFVCDVDVSTISPNPRLDSLLHQLTQDKYIFTDSTYRHTRDSLNQIGISDTHFKGIFENRDSGFRYKTDPECHRCFLNKYQLCPADCVLFEDNVNNLRPAQELGMATVLISPNYRENLTVDYQFPDIETALSSLF